MTSLNLLRQLREFNLLPFGSTSTGDESIDDPISDYDFATKLYVDNEISGKGSPAPTGSLVMFPSNVPPSGWLLCDGSEVDRVVYSNLFSLIGVTFGIGDGANTFNLPDMRGRFPLGMDDPGAGTAGPANVVANPAADSIGGTSGSETVTLTSAQMPVHGHSGSTGSDSHSHSGSTSGTGSHTHSYSDSTVGSLAGRADGGGTAYNSSSILNKTTGTSGNHTHTVSTSSDSHSHTVSVGSAGSGDAHDNMPPFLAINYIIKA